ncbi:hypothetical protein CDAR_550951 [Caerostris darwini]|uniref:Uncharacterized protein n=1 Tax=Caerostris darwini TaxID=1538125 RepID=A0AAV4QJ66_9ARAC|nr:hypothetical protein CDAR_550951 [Caerostris darwini]
MQRISNNLNKLNILMLALLTSLIKVWHSWNSTAKPLPFAIVTTLKSHPRLRPIEQESVIKIALVARFPPPPLFTQPPFVLPPSPQYDNEGKRAVLRPEDIFPHTTQPDSNLSDCSKRKVVNYPSTGKSAKNTTPSRTPTPALLPLPREKRTSGNFRANALIDFVEGQTIISEKVPRRFSFSKATADLISFFEKRFWIFSFG